MEEEDENDDDEDEDVERDRFWRDDAVGGRIAMGLEVLTEAAGEEEAVDSDGEMEAVAEPEDERVER